MTSSSHYMPSRPPIWQTRFTSRATVWKHSKYLFGATPGAGKAVPEKPKLILLDLKLPRVDGHEVLKHIKNDPRTSAIPVVVLTSSSEERNVMQTYEVGANSYIIKPVDFEQFTESVRDIGKYWLVINHAQSG
jgi:two-component system response regulator